MIVAIVFVVALFGASQDIVIDAYRRELLADDDSEPARQSSSMRTAFPVWCRVLWL